MKILFSLVAISLFLACEETDDGTECPGFASCIDHSEYTIDDLDSMRQEIISLAADSGCDEGVCDFIGFGSKPCGGPWEYLIFSSTVDTASLFNLVSRYNELEEQLNIRDGRGSDCAIAPAPDSVVCESGGCVAYKNEMAYTEGVCCN
ncbi:MAG: hypothetical protein ABJD58_13795 [Cyclobacteriaceae bacterium]